MRWWLWLSLLAVGCSAAEDGVVAEAGPAADAARDAAPDVASDAAAATGLAVGQRAPGFALLNQDGEQVALADFRGQPTLVVGSSMW